MATGMQTEEEKVKWASSQRSDAPQASVEPIVPNRSLYKSYYSNIDDGVTIRITAVRGRGFNIRKRRIGKKDDVPDVYAVIKLNKADGEDKSPKWQTATIKDDTMPTWNESRDFTHVDPVRDVVVVELYDENKGKDEYLGTAAFSVEKLLRKRVLEIELRDGSELTESYVTLRCLHLERTAEEKAEVGDVLVHCHPELGDEGIESTMVNGKKASVYGNTDDDSEDDDDDVVMPLVSVSAPPTSRPSRGSYSDDDEHSLNSTSSSSSMSKKMRKIKSFPGKIGKRLSLSSKKKKEEG